MLLKLLLGFLFGTGAFAAESTKKRGSLHSAHPLLLVSFDGFRADYLQRFPMPNLRNLYSEGVLVEQMTNVFVTKTFPNHYSLVTGLYAESHGIVASTMYDPVSHKHFHIYNDSDSMWWEKAQPLWITARDSDYKTAAVMWPGSDVHIKNRTATHFFPYNEAVTFRERLGNVTKWMLGDGKEPGTMFSAMYWEEPDRSGHRYGPENTTVMAKVLKEVDDHIGLLISELKRVGLWGRVNILVTSDHGMAQCSADRLIRLDDCVHPDNYTVVDITPVAALIPKTNPDAIFRQLSKCHAHMTAYLKRTIPDRLHYRNNERVQPIILIADEGWTIVPRGDRLPNLGDHGYDNSLPSMHPFLAAVGPDFRRGHRISEIHSVDIYPLMCHLLSVPPRPNNGSLNRVRCLLAAESCMEAPLAIGVMMCVMLLLGVVTVVRFLRFRRISGSWSFQRVHIEAINGDDDPLLD